MFGYSAAADWSNEHASPIVWPSNDALARQLGLSVSTTRHHLRGLAAPGLIAHASHPTFQRRGVRDDQGNIVEAFGIDLSPIIMRCEKLLATALTYEHEGRERRGLSYRRTQLRREIEAILAAARRDGLVGNWQLFQARLDRLRESVTRNLEQFRETIDALLLLRDEVEAAYSSVPIRSDLDTAVTIFRHVQTTAESSSERKSRKPGAAENPSHTSDAAPRPAPRTSGKRTPEAGSDVISDRTGVECTRIDIGQVSLGLVRSACPALMKHRPAVFDSWTALRSSGRQLCAATAINTQVWSEAETYLGPDAAIAALAVTIQRADEGQVANPGAYFRTLVQRGRKGQLHISRSLFALAGNKSEAVSRQPPPPQPPHCGFPTAGISWSSWADLVREHTTKPTPDVENVAEAFRAWCRKGNIDLAQPSIEKAFIGFCKKWRPR